MCPGSPRCRALGKASRQPWQGLRGHPRHGANRKPANLPREAAGSYPDTRGPVNGCNSCRSRPRSVDWRGSTPLLGESMLSAVREAGKDAGFDSYRDRLLRPTRFNLLQAAFQCHSCYLWTRPLSCNNSATMKKKKSIEWFPVVAFINKLSRSRIEEQHCPKEENFFAKERNSFLIASSQVQGVGSACLPADLSAHPVTPQLTCRLGN